MAFQKQLLPDCPQCKQPGLRVLESRKASHGTRRRKRCECCEYRFTTYEVTADFYNEAQQNLLLISQLHKLLGSQVIPSGSTEIKCKTCIHNEAGRCAFDFPEYDTTDSYDCNHYEH